MIQLHIEATNVDELFSELDKLRTMQTVKDLTKMGAQIAIAPKASAPALDRKPVVPAPQEEAPAVSEEPETPAMSEEPETPSVPEAQKAPTMEQTRAALNALRQKNGPKAVRAILDTHSVSSFTDLQPSEYAAVIAEAEEAANG